jgi:hypothetical protein
MGYLNPDLEKKGMDKIMEQKQNGRHTFGEAVWNAVELPTNRIPLQVRQWGWTPVKPLFARDHSDNVRITSPFIVTAKLGPIEE